MAKDDQGDPSLNDCLRGSIEDMEKASDIVWEEANQTIQLSTEERQAYARKARGDDRDVDEAWAKIIDGDDKIAGAAQVPKGFMRQNLDQGSAIKRQERAGLDMGRGVVDGTRLIRVGLYGLNGKAEGQVAQIRKDGSGPWALRQWLKVLWGEVYEQENAPVEKGKKGRKHAQAQQAVHDEQVQKITQNADDAEAVSEFLQAIQHAGVPLPRVPQRSSKQGQLPAPSRSASARAGGKKHR